MDKYIYNGPVTEFGICIANCWRAETIASSKSKAKSNLKYQFKQLNNKIASTKIDLPGEVKLVV